MSRKLFTDREIRDMEGSQLDLLTHAELVRLVNTIRNQVIYHETQDGHSRCWLDDELLYQVVIPNYQPRLRRLPPKEEFIQQCERFHKCRQSAEGSIPDIYLGWVDEK